MRKGIFVVIGILLVFNLSFVFIQGEDLLNEDFVGDSSIDIATQTGIEDLEVENLNVQVDEDGNTILSPASGLGDDADFGMRLGKSDFDLSSEDSYVKLDSEGNVLSGKFSTPSTPENFEFEGEKVLTNVPAESSIIFEENSLSLNYPGTVGEKTLTFDNVDPDSTFDVEFQGDKIRNLEIVAGEGGANFDYLGGKFKIPEDSTLSASGGIWNLPENSEISSLPSYEGVDSFVEYRGGKVQADFLMEGNNIKLSKELTGGIFNGGLSFNGSLASSDSRMFLPPKGDLDFSNKVKLSQGTANTFLFFGEEEIQESDFINFGMDSFKMGSSSGGGRVCDVEFFPGNPYLGEFMEKNDYFALAPTFSQSDASFELISPKPLENDKNSLPILRTKGFTTIGQDGKQLTSISDKSELRLSNALDVGIPEGERKGIVPMIVVSELDNDKIATLFTKNRDRAYYAREKTIGSISLIDVLGDEHESLDKFVNEFPFKDITDPFAKELKVGSNLVDMIDNQNFVGEVGAFKNAGKNVNLLQPHMANELENTFALTPEFEGKGRDVFDELQVGIQGISSDPSLTDVQKEAQIQQLKDNLATEYGLNSLPSLSPQQANLVIQENLGKVPQGYDYDSYNNDLKNIQVFRNSLKQQGLNLKGADAGTSLLGIKERAFIQKKANEMGISFNDYFVNYHKIIPGVEVATYESYIPPTSLLGDFNRKP